MDLTVELISEYWPLDHVTEPILKRKGAGSVFAIRSAQGSFIVKVYEGPGALGLVCPTREELRQCLHVFEYLRLKNFGHIPTLFKTKAGETFLSEGNQTIYIIEQIEGANPPASAETWAELGRLAARLNSYSDYLYDYPIAVDGTIPELTRAAEQYPFRNEFLELVEKLGVLVDQPASLIHAEINPGNSFRTPDGKMYILDWDSVGTGPTVLEVGYPLICCFIDESDLTFHHDWAAAYYRGYTEGAGMTEDQKNLVFTAALLHALRYISSGNTTSQRWARIRYALENKERLLSAIPTKHARS